MKNANMRIKAVSVSFSMEKIIKEALLSAQKNTAYGKLTFEQFWMMCERKPDRQRYDLFFEWVNQVSAEIISNLPEASPTTFLIGRSWNRYHHDKEYIITEEKDLSRVRQTFIKTTEKNCINDHLIISTADSFIAQGMFQGAKKIYLFFSAFPNGTPPGYSGEIIFDKTTHKLEKVLTPEFPRP